MSRIPSIVTCDALISLDIGVMSRIPAGGTYDALISLDIGVMSRIPSIVTCDALISLDIGVMSHIPSAVTCGFSIWTVAGSLVAASHLWDESGSLGVVAEPLRWRLTSV